MWSPPLTSCLSLWGWVSSSIKPRWPQSLPHWVFVRTAWNKIHVKHLAWAWPTKVFHKGSDHSEKGSWQVARGVWRKVRPGLKTVSIQSRKKVVHTRKLTVSICYPENHQNLLFWPLFSGLGQLLSLVRLGEQAALANDQPDTQPIERHFSVPVAGLAGELCVFARWMVLPLSMKQGGGGQSCRRTKSVLSWAGLTCLCILVRFVVSSWNIWGEKKKKG